jgi:hypothetical protein
MFDTVFTYQMGVICFEFVRICRELEATGLYEW